MITRNDLIEKNWTESFGDYFKKDCFTFDLECNMVSKAENGCTFTDFNNIEELEEFILSEPEEWM